MKITALYLRLSHADNDLGENEKDESNSIENQRKLLRDYVESNDSIGEEVEEYVDDGFTGTNFDRPGFQRMIEDAKKGKIGVVLVKDLSRLGRDYIGVGDYLEQILPSMGVRVIAVNSNYDSDNYTGNTFGMDVSITNLVNSLYSKDLSKKVRSGKITKWKSGISTGERKPFGYVRDPIKQNTWIIEPDAAKIVKLIFEKANDGWGTRQIVDLLNELGLPTPSALYKEKYGKDFSALKVKENENIWDISKVWRIIRCYTYTGNVVHGQRTRIIIGSTTARKVPEKDRVIVRNAVPAIITEEEFNTAQLAIQRQGTDNKGNDKGYALTRKIKCGNCGLSMTYREKDGLCLSCRHAMVSGKKTTCKRIDYPAGVIENAVYQVVKNQMELLNSLWNKIALKQEESKNSVLNSAKSIEARITALQGEKVRKYESYANGNIDKESFLNAKRNIDEEIKALTLIQQGQEKEDSKVDELLYEIEKYTDKSLPILSKGRLTRNIANRFVDSVYVYSADRVEVNLKFQSILDQALLEAGSDK